jgi:Transglycosylase SLT domain
MRLWLAGFLAGPALAIGTRALADIPVKDHTVLAEREERDEKTSEIDEVDMDRFIVNKSVTCSMYRPGGRDDPVGTANANPEIAGLVGRIAREEGVNENEFLALVYQESRFNPCAKSGVGAIGLAQLMPGTAEDLGVNPYNIEQNLHGGARYYKQQLRRFNGNVNLALAAYNSGPGNVQKYRGIPPFKETQSYVGNITQEWLPAFGGSDKRGIPLNFGGGNTAYTGMRDSTINAMAASGATSDSLSNVASWLAQLAAMQSGTIHDSWDHNSGVRNANLEMINATIRTGTAMADLINSRNAVTASGLSGSSQTTEFLDEDDDPQEATDPCDVRAGSEWDDQEQACVEKREPANEVQLLLQPQ